MGIIVALAIVAFVAATAGILMTTPPARLAALLRRAAFIVPVVAGVALILVGRAAIGGPLVLIGLTAYRRNASSSARPDGPKPREASQVRSAALAMRLDHDTGELDGTVLTGRFEGRALSHLSDAELAELRTEIEPDAESLSLLEAYLDRRVPGWRADAKAGAGDGLGGAPGAGPMTEQQAHQILGLEPGASLAEIREAHRRLMKRVHPDHGGTDFLAARINEAKAFLVERHR